MKQFLQESSNYDKSHNPALPDKKKPWCLNCRLHTNWYSTYEGRAVDKKHKVLRCKVCDGPTYWLVNPKTFNLASIATVLFCFIVGSALATNGFGLAGGPAAEDEFFTGLFCFPFGIFAAYMLHSRSKGVRKKWKEFDKWVEEQSEG